ncbi:MAG: alpha/beta hydrolase family protein [Acidobacteriota bacterium]
MRRLSHLLFILLLAGSCSLAQFTVYDGQTLRKGAYSFTTKQESHRLNSKLMGREMPYIALLPDHYDPQDSRKYSTVYLLHGLSGHFDNWTLKTKIAETAAFCQCIVITPEGDDSWYTDSSSKPNDKYESYVIKELIPEIDKKFRTIADRGNRAIAGLSMGGYGAIKFGLKYPDMFVVAGSFSGPLDAAARTEKNMPGAIGKSIDATFGPPDREVRKANDLFDIVQRISSEKIKALPFLYIDCGTEDFLFQNNRAFVDLLLEKKVPHEFRQLPGGHNWKYWDAQVQEFLELAANRFSTGQKREPQ